MISKKDILAHGEKLAEGYIESMTAKIYPNEWYCNIEEKQVWDDCWTAAIELLWPLVERLQVLVKEDYHNQHDTKALSALEQKLKETK